MIEDPENSIPRAAFERHRVEERYADATADLPFFLEGAMNDANNLSLLISTAQDAACCGLALDPDRTEAVDALQIAGQASAALFLAASSQRLPVTIALGTGRCVLETRPDESTVHAFRWVRGFFLNAIFRASEHLNAMCQCPTELLRRSNTADPEYRYLFVDALREFWNGGDSSRQTIVDALEATDPDRVDIRSPEWTLNLDVPQLQLLFYVNEREHDFAPNLPKAVALHKDYWTSNRKRRNDWDGFLSIELAGLAALARDRGMSFRIDSDYVPNSLVYFK